MDNQSLVSAHLLLSRPSRSIKKLNRDLAPVKATNNVTLPGKYDIQPQEEDNGDGVYSLVFNVTFEDNERFQLNYDSDESTDSTVVDAKPE